MNRVKFTIICLTVCMSVSAGSEPGVDFASNYQTGLGAGRHATEVPNGDVTMHYVNRFHGQRVNMTQDTDIQVPSDSANKVEDGSGEYKSAAPETVDETRGKPPAAPTGLTIRIN